MRTSDGVRLDADVYRPAGGGDHPVLLMRQPYGRRIATTVCYAHPAWYAAQGYIVVVQDVRGRGTSEGTFTLFEQEAADGAESVDWCATLPGSTGAVGMYGFSYQGVTQLLAAAAGPAALKAIAPAMIGWDLRQDWAWSGGAFCLAANLSWAVQIAAQEARRQGDAAAFAELAEAARSLPIGRTIAARPDILDAHARYAPHHARWRDAAADDPYWARISPAAHAGALTTGGPPALFVSGWYDSHLTGTVAAYRAYQTAGAAAELVIGPWAHFPWGRWIGGRDFGTAAIGDIDRRQIAFFDRHLKGHVRPATPPVRLFDTGADRWIERADWPADLAAWRIAGGGRAALDERDGRLGPQVAGEAAAERLVHDPWRPVQTVGGALGTVAGPLDRTEADARPDVLTYTTDPLPAPLTLAGEPVAVLAATADRPSFDLSCTLTLVGADGRSVWLSDGYRHCPAELPEPVRIVLRPLCVTIPAGARLRLAVAGACFPAFPVNPGTGERPVDAAVDSAEVTTIRLGHDESRLFVPIAPA
ncbi:MAG: CocE/NonD family hydrolase [Sphingomonas fennica]